MFAWKDSFNTTIDEIDKQHKKLFEIGGRLYYTVGLNDEYDHYDEIMEIVKELTDYTIFHFGYEEELMKKAEYPDYEKQKIQHGFFVKKLQKISGKDLEDSQHEVLLELLNFLSNWISGHILEEDMKYVPYLKNES